MKVGLLTLEQKDLLVGQLVQHDWYFNPVQDVNSNWVVSTEEMDQCMYFDDYWVKNLPQIDWLGPLAPPTPPNV